jgi:flagellar motor switch protein FliM
MADILSQSQIDDLLNELIGETDSSEKSNIGLNEKTFKVYDFKSPKKMSKDQYKLLSSITDILARHLSAYFAGLLRSYCEITLATIDEHPYYEYNNSLPDSILTGVIDIDSIGTLLIDMSNSVSFTLVERMLGSNIFSSVVPDREFTEIEISLMERIFKKICLFIKEALTALPNSQVELRQIETNSRFIKSIRIEEVVEVIIYNVVIGPVKGTLTICIPYTCVDSLVSTMEQHNEKEKTGVASDEVKRNLLNELSGTLVDVAAILGNATLPLKDILNLQPGDVIRLNQKIDSPVVVTVNKNKWFLGEPGLKRNYKAVKINKYYKGRSKQA